MKKFLQKIALFLLILLMFFIVGILLPVTPRASTSMLFAEIQKDSLLANVPAPRLILIGGSSISVSINSKHIKDSLGLNPINTGVHAATGLVFMLDHTIKFIQKGDVVVIVPEYDQLFGNFAYGAQELLRTILDVKIDNVFDLRMQQLRNIVPFLPQYALSKFRPSEYIESHDNMIYLRNAFNKYGDCNIRDEHHPPNTLVFFPLPDAFNNDIINELKVFETKANEKGAKVILSFPAFQDESYDNFADNIEQVEQAYRNNGFKVIGDPAAYKFPNSLIYDTPYHLKTKGVEIRTQMLIKQLINEAHLKRAQ